MTRYLIKRALLIAPTLLGVVIINFMVLQLVPGGPVERALSTISVSDMAASGVGVSSALEGGPQSGDGYIGAQGIDPALIAELERQYGLDRPMHERLFRTLRNYAQFDFGESFYQKRPVVDIIAEKAPASIFIVMTVMVVTYGVSIAFGALKAMRSDSVFDTVSSVVLLVFYAVPSYLVAVTLIVFLCGGTFLNIFPLRGLVSAEWQDLSFFGRVGDLAWHAVLPVFALASGAIAALTMLVKTSVLEEFGKPYVSTARAKGLSERAMMTSHVLPNALLVVVAGFPATFIGLLFSGTLLIEVIFSINGLGLLAYESAVSRDYPVMLGVLFMFSLSAIVINLLGDIAYTMLDPRISFGARNV